MNQLIHRITDLFTLRYRSRSQFVSDYEFRSYYAGEHARVRINSMAAALVGGLLLGALFMWLGMQGGAL
jgi:hypothetical protein